MPGQLGQSLCLLIIILRFAWMPTCQGLASPSVLKMEVAQQMVSAPLRGNASSFMAAAEAGKVKVADEPVPPKVAFTNLMKFMVGWMLVVSAIAALNAWQDPPMRGIFTLLCCLTCPGGIFALCYPVDGPVTSCGNGEKEEGERRPMLGRGNTQALAQEDDGWSGNLWVAAKGFNGTLYVAFICVSIGLGIYGMVQGCGGAAMQYSAVLMFKGVLMFLILCLQGYFHSIVKDYYSTSIVAMPTHAQPFGGPFGSPLGGSNYFPGIPQILSMTTFKLPDDEDLHARIKLIMRIQRVIFWMSAGLTFGSFIVVPQDPDAEPCATASMQTIPIQFCCGGWVGMIIVAVAVFFMKKMTLNEMADWFVKHGQVVIL